MGTWEDTIERWERSRQRTREETIARAREKRRAAGDRHDMGVYGDVSTQQAIDLYVGGERADRVAVDQGVGLGPGRFDMDRYRRGDLSDDQIVDMFVHQAPRENSRWQNRDGTWDNSVRRRALDLDEAVRSTLSVMPELAEDPTTLWSIVNEPFLAQRLRGMAKARDFLSLRAEIARTSRMPTEHQTAWWDQMTRAEQDAYRIAGYTPPAEMPEVKASGIGGAFSALGQKLGTAAEYTNLDVPLGAVSEGIGGTFELMVDVANVPLTAYRFGSYMAGGNGEWDNWFDALHRAWEGESFFRDNNIEEAREIAEGNEDRLNLYLRLAAGETIDEITADYADIGTTEYADAWEQLARFQQDERTARAVQTLQRGTISPGRDVAENIIRLDEDSMFHSTISGAVDAYLLYKADPFLIASKTRKASLYRRFGLVADDPVAQAQRLANLMGTANGRDLSIAVDAARGGQAVNVHSPRYWSSINALPVDDVQRGMVAMADHMNDFLTNGYNKEAWRRFGEALPNARPMFQTFQRYIETVARVAPDGNPVRAVKVDDVVRFYQTAPDTRATLGVDDVVEFTKDNSGMWALASGQWSSVRHDRILMPRLTRLGARRIQAKMAMTDTINWAEEGILRLAGDARFAPEDLESPAMALATVNDAHQIGAKAELEGAMHDLRTALWDQGFDGDTIGRALDREVLRMAELTSLPGESPSQTIMRNIVMAPDLEMADDLRGMWRTGLSVHLGDDAAAAYLDNAENLYRRALGLTDETGNIIDRGTTLDQAVAAATNSWTDAGVSRERNRYAKALRNTGADEDQIDDALDAFDLLVAERRNATADAPVSDVDPETTNLLTRLVAVPVAKTLFAPVKFGRLMAMQIPKKNVLVLDGKDTPEILEQLLNFGIRGARGRQLFGEFMAASEGGRRMVVRNIYHELFDRLGILDDPQHADFVQSWLNSTNQVYGVDDLVDGPLGRQHAGFYPDAHRATAVAIPKFRELDAHLKRSRFLSFLNGAGNKRLGINSDATETFMGIWRASVVLRPAMIPRAGGEELLAQYARWGPSHVFKQFFVNRFVKADPLVESQVSRINAALHDDAMAVTLQGVDDARNPAHAIAQVWGRTLDGLAQRARTPEEQHALVAAAHSRSTQHAFGEVSGVNAGIVPMGKLGSEAEEGGDYAFEVLNTTTGEREMLNLNPVGGHYKEAHLGDQFFREHLSGQWKMMTVDETGRAAARVLARRVPEEQAGRIRDVANAHLGFTDDLDNGEVIHRLRRGFAALGDEDYDYLTRWLDTQRTIGVGNKLLSDDGWKAMHAAVGTGGPWHRFRAQMRQVLDELDYGDRNALLVYEQAHPTLPTGVAEALQHGPAYRGASLNVDDAGLLFGPGHTFNDVAELVAGTGAHGPGVYVTADGAVAEIYMGARLAPGGIQVSSRPQVLRLGWRNGTPAKVLQGGDVEHSAEMARQVNLMQADLLRAQAPGDIGEAAAIAFEQNLTVDEAMAMARDLYGDDTAEAVGRIVGSDVWQVAGAPDHVATELWDVVHQARERADRLTAALDRGVTVAARPGQIYNEYYSRHVVDHFSAQGYRGIQQARSNSAVMWHPGADLEVLGKVDWRDSLATRIVERQQARRSHIEEQARMAGGDDAVELHRRLAEEEVLRVLTAPENQHKLARMEAMQGVVQPPGKRMIRAQVPVIPKAVLRRLQEKIRTTGTSDELQDVGAATGTAPALERSSLLADVADPDLRRYLDDLIQRLDASPTDTHLSARLATTDLTVADEILARLRGVVQRHLSAEDAQQVHLGHVDLVTGEWNALEEAARRGDNLVGEPTLRWIDNDMVLERAVSWSADDVHTIAVDWTDTDRAAAMWLVDDGTPIAGDTELLDRLRTAVDHDPDLAARLPQALRDALPEGAPTRWTKAEGRSWFDASRDLARKIAHNAEAQTTGASGNVMHGVLRPIADGTYDARKHLIDRDLGSLPEVTFGPELRALERDGAIRGFANKNMNRIGRGISWMSRHPIFRKTFTDAYTDAIKIMRPAMSTPGVAKAAGRHVRDIDTAGDRLYETAISMDMAEHGYRLDDLDVIEILAEGKFIDLDTPLYTWEKNARTGAVERVRTRSELTDAEQKIVKWWRQEEHLRTESMMAANVRAVDATIPYIDDHHIRSQWAEKVRNVVPFWFAEEQFYKRWVRTFVHSPEAFRRLTLAHNAFRSVGWIDTNEYGEEVFAYPGAQYVAGAIGKVLDFMPIDAKFTLPIQPMLEGQLAYAAPGFDRLAIPGAGPVAAIPLRILRSIAPQVATPLEETILGERGVGRSIPEMVLPTAAYRMLRFATASDDDLNSAVIAAMQLMEANHPDDVPAGDATPEEVDEYFERLRNHARVMLFVKGTFGMIAPASPSVDYDPEGLSDEFSSYLQAGVPIDIAVADFLQAHPDATPFTLFATESPSKAPVDPTEAAYEELLTNGDFYDEHRGAGPWLLPAGAPDDPFDRQAWHEMLAHKVRTRKGDVEFYKDLKFSEGAEVYFDSRDERDRALAETTDSNQRRLIEQSWRTWSEDYLNGHRIFRDQLRSRESADRRQAVLDDMLLALDDERAPQVEHAPLLRELIESYNEYESVRLEWADDNRSAAVNYRKQLRSTFLTWGEEYSRAHPTARQFWTRILLPQVDPTGGYSADLDEDDEQEGAA